MIDQILKVTQEVGQQAVINDPKVPNEYNQEVVADATKTIASGFQNVMAGGGLQNIIDLFKGGGGGGGNTDSKSSGIGGLLKNPMVTMMIGYFINKLVSKYKMNASSASSVANNLIPNVLNNLVSRTNSNAPENDAFDLNDLIGSLTGGKVATGGSGGGFDFQGLLEQFTGNKGSNESSNKGFDLQDIISQVTSGAQQNQEEQNSGGGGGLMDLIKGFMR